LSRYSFPFTAIVGQERMKLALGETVLIENVTGAGGSLGFADPEAKIGFGYAMNRMGGGILLDPRAKSLIAAAYARVSYARELQGDLPGALRLMQMAVEATAPQDAESIAWHHAQIGHLYLQMGRIDEAEREYQHAEFAFPGHPFAADGLARVAAARGDYARALELATPHHAGLPTATEAALAGDLLTALGRTDEAERQYALAEAAGRKATSPAPAGEIHPELDASCRARQVLSAQGAEGSGSRAGTT